ncbi:MAG: hypothetical protein P9L97_06100 [Candidatus Tenebribacter davisii]|nr:hypothetical protein [Candidatus Tenebribacter davisii]
MNIETVILSKNKIMHIYRDPDNHYFYTGLVWQYDNATLTFARGNPYVINDDSSENMLTATAITETWVMLMWGPHPEVDHRVQRVDVQDLQLIIGRIK